LSRLRSTRGNSAPAARTNRPGVYVASPKSDIYVTLLSVSLGAMVLACLLLTVLLNEYGFKLKP
jgi:hypothetical protein